MTLTNRGLLISVAIAKLGRIDERDYIIRA